jgi:hypothetical protein
MGSNHQGLHFFTIKTTNAAGQADIWALPDKWVQGDICAKFKIKLEFEFKQDLE